MYQRGNDLLFDDGVEGENSQWGQSEHLIGWRQYVQVLTIITFLRDELTVNWFVWLRTQYLRQLTWHLATEMMQYKIKWHLIMAANEVATGDSLR